MLQSVSGPQYCLHLLMTHHVLPQPVILIVADIRERIRTGEREI